MDDLTLWGLFVSAFISSTLLPGGSEVVLAALVSGNNHDPLILLAIASVGNTLGGVSSWLIGRLIAIRLPTTALTKSEHQRALVQVQRWGSPILLLSWVPILGDPLCVAAGWLKINFWLSTLFIALGKTARYAIIVLLVP